MENNNGNGWNEYKLLVIKQLEGLTDKTESIETKLDGLIVEFAIVKTKVGFMSAGVALSVTVLGNVIFYLITHPVINRLASDVIFDNIVPAISTIWSAWI